MEDRGSQIFTVVKLAISLTLLCFLLHTLYLLRNSLIHLKCDPYDRRCSVTLASEDFADEITTTTTFVKNDQRPKILIFSLPRSGSSFFGELFNREDDTFYLYEPLHASEALTTLTPSSSEQAHGAAVNTQVVQRLNDLYKCDFKDHEYLFRLISYPEFSNPHFRLMSKVLASPPFCDYVMHSNATEAEYRKHCRTVDTRSLMGICADKKMVVIKELMHRLPVYSPKDMSLLLQVENLKTIWLVRDPRAIIASMISMGWITETKTQTFEQVFESTTNKVCQLYEQFLVTMSLMPVRYRQMLNVLRYEDLVTRPRDVVLQIIQLSDGVITEKSLEWIVRNTQEESTAYKTEQEDSYSVHGRNATYSMTSWRSRFNLQQIFLIQGHCRNFMDRLGYNHFWENKTLIDLSIPSYRTVNRF